MHYVSLRFFDAEAVVECRSAALQLAFQQLYDITGSSGRDPVRYRVGDGVEALWPGARQWVRLAREGVPDSLAHALVFSSLAARVQSHWLLHAGALAGPAGGILLVGESGSGKTTLALGLAERGYAWMSDEVAALDRTTGLLSPFPRAALVRPGTLRLLPDLAGRMQPWPLPDDGVAGRWRPTDCAVPAPIRTVIFLGRDAAPGPTGVAIGDLPPGLSARLEADQDLAGATATRRCGCVVLSWPHPLSAQALARMEGFCRAEGELLLNVRAPSTASDFQAPPRIAPCASSAAWLRLAAAAWNRRAGLDQSPGARGGEVMPMMQELAAAMRDAICYTLRPGPLDETLALIERMASSAAAAGRAGIRMT